MKRSVRDFIIFIVVLILLSISVTAMARGARKAWTTRKEKVAAVKQYFARPTERQFIFSQTK